jgi:uncharacterized membrane protein
MMISLRRGFIFASCTWACSLPAAAWLSTAPHAAPVAGASLAAYAIGAVVCHQLPWRSFHLWGAQLPVCARCTGIYVASAVVAAAAPWLPPARQPAARRLLIASIVPTAATLLFEWVSGTVPSNVTRAVAGAPIGAAVAWVVVRL